MGDRTLPLAVLVGVCLTFGEAGAQAQTVAVQHRDEAGAADIIVTARRVEERLQDVPISITVFNQQQLTARNVFNAGDLATYTPSLTANARFGSENTSFAIRGFVQDNGTAPSVAVYFADVAALRAAGGITTGNGAGPGSLFDLANVQVLKGSQGTLFGRNTTGGAVLLVPQKPTGRLGGYIEGSIGNFDMRRIQAVVNLPVSSTLRLRLGVDHQTRTGYLKNYSGIGPRDFSDVDYKAARFSAVADLRPNLENYLVASYSDSDTHGYLPQVFTCAPSVLAVPAGSSAGLLASSAAQQGVAALGCNQIGRRIARGGGFYDVESSTISPRQHTRQWQIINTTRWQASDALTIKNIVSYGQFREYFRGAVYGDNLILTSGPYAGQTFIKQQSNSDDRDISGESTFTEELQMHATALDGRLDGQIGGYLEISEPLGFTGSRSPNSAYCTNAQVFQCVSAGLTGVTSLIISRYNKQSFHNHAFYGQTTYKLTDRLSATAGVRYTWDRTRAETRQLFYVPLPVTANPAIGRCAVGPLTTGTEADCSTVLRQKASKPTWLADIDYKPTDDILLYAKYTRGYRAGGLKTDGGALFAAFDPEKVDTYEAGFKTDWRGPVRGTFNVTGFYSDFTNQQLASRLDPNPTGPLVGTTPLQVIASVGKSRIYGVEAEASVTPLRGLTIEGNYAYLNARLKSITGLPDASTALYLVPIPSGTAPGYPLGYTPKNKYTATISYTLPIDADIGKITIGATYSHTGSLLSSAGYIIPVVAPTATNPSPIVPINVTGVNYAQLPALNLLNANLSWTSIAGRPLDLSLFVTNLANRKYVTAVFGGIGAFGYDARSLGEPRMWGLRLKYRFGA